MSNFARQILAVFLHRGIARGLFLFAAASIAFVLVSCGKRSPQEIAFSKGEPPKLVILGIDGFDWSIVDPLVQSGRMPVMKRLLDQGVRADLLTLVPLEKSPVIWTTIATGRLPAEPEKGRDFVMDGANGAPKAFTSWHRRTRAFWNILTEQGRTASVIGWLETWPAEEVAGTIVSDYVQYDIGERQKLARTDRRTYPQALQPMIDSLVVYPRDLALADLRPLLGGTFDSTRAIPGMRESLDALRWIYAGDLTFTAIGRVILEHFPTEVVAIYLRGPDAVCHKFWEDRDWLAKGGGDPERVRILGPTVDLYYEETDRLIGQILEKIDLERTSLFLVSDHGFQGPRISLDGTPRLGIWMHREIGTAFLAGPAAKGKGLRGAGARVQDVLPTILHILSLPVAKDLDGEVAMDLLGAKGGKDRKIEEIATYETGQPPSPGEEPESPVSEEIAERMKSLGYVR
jgi:hypothetical protein